MKRKTHMLQRPYQVALGRYLRHGRPSNLVPAGRIGRKAVALGLETLDLALIHEKALLVAIASAPSQVRADREKIIRNSAVFFAEAILPLEATHQTALKANARLGELNRELSRRRQELLKSNQKLTREIVRRRTAQESLLKSERHSGLLLVESKRLQEQLRLLSRRVIATQEDERKRISRELHDVVAQMLTGINVRLAALKAESTAGSRGLTQKIARTQRMVEKSVDIVHRFDRELRPAVLDDLGLIPAVHSFLKGFARETGIRATVTASAGVEDLSVAKRTVLYRVAQEALANVARHAQAGRVEVSILKLSSAVRMQIKDDGKGLDVPRQHLGMLGMRERVEMIGGTFTVKSALGAGTTVTAEIPLNNGKREPAER